MNKSVKVLSMGILLSLLAAPVLAQEVLVLQKDKAFTDGDGNNVETLQLKVGDEVDFKNADPFFHNVFSLSDAQFFDLGSYPQGESKKVKLEQAGSVEVECSIHPEMQLKIEVSE